MLAVSTFGQIIRGPVTTSSDGRSLIILDKAGMQAFLGFTTNGIIVGNTNLNIIAGTNISVVVANGTNIIISADVGYQMASNIASTVVANLATTPNRVLSLYAPPNGDTNWFGPWTSGTLTAGIQEAINSLPLATNSIRPGGGTLVFTPGSYETYTNIHFPTSVATNPYNLHMVGCGMTASGITYLGTVPQNVLSIGRSQSKTPYIFSMENMWVASNTNACTNVILLEGASDGGGVRGGGVARASIEFCYIGWWQSMTNNTCFGSQPVFTPSSCTDGKKHNLIGVNVNLNFNDPVSISKNSFNYLGTAISWACDHGVIEDNTFEQCGKSTGNDWPTSSPYFPGPTIALLDPVLLNNGNKDWRIKGNNFVGCPLHYLAKLFATDSTNMYYRNINNTLIQDDSDEAGTALAATTGATLTFLNPRAASYSLNPLPSYYITNTTDYTSWATRIASNAPANNSNSVIIVDLRMATNTAGYSFGGPVVADSFYGSSIGLGSTSNRWKVDVIRPGYRLGRFISTDDDAVMLLGSGIAGSTNWIIAATSVSSGLSANKLVIGRSDSDAGVGTAVPLILITPTTGAVEFRGILSGDGTGITNVNAASLQGVNTNNFAMAYTNLDLSLTIAAKLNLTNPPAIRGFYLWTNSAFPAAADVGGSSFVANSNGVTYILSSGPFSTAWTATNKIAP